MSNIPADLQYTKEHVWVKVEGNIVVMGITDYAQDQLGDIIFVDLPEIDEEILIGDVFTEFESSRMTCEVLSPVSGKIVASNEELDYSPELINEDAYANWIVKILFSDDTELDDLLSSEEYRVCIDE